jgi:hypothetical protein
MTSSMTLFWPKILSMADSFDSISTNIGGRSNIRDCTKYLHNEIWPTRLLHHDTVIAVKNTFDLCGFEA